MSAQNNNKAFCVLPWVHLYIEPSGDVFTCCLKDEKAQPLGNINEQAVSDVWNSEGLKQVRLDFLNGKKRADICNLCYQQEASGSFSHRVHYNQKFLPLVEEQIHSLTKEDGHFDQFKLFYWDFRFSNICNLKCRTCGPIYSSSWYSDAKELGSYDPSKKLLDRKDKFEFLTHHIEHVEEIYFAGGEPLLMEEHYKILNLLLEKNRLNVKLSYNSSCNNINYKGQSITEYWKHFTNVVLSPSIDHFGKKSEIMRSGSRWDDVVNNIKKIQQETPHVFIHPTITVSNMNILDLPEVLLEFDREGLINLDNQDKLTFNILRTPEYFHVGMLSDDLKIKAIYKLKSFEAFLKEKRNIKLQDFSSIYAALGIDFGQEKKNFLDITSKLDSLRGENFFETFSELKNLDGSSGDEK